RISLSSSAGSAATSSVTELAQPERTSFSMPTAEQIWPGVQYPHWYASQATNASWTGCGPIPSMVVTVRSARVTARTRHELTRRPSSSTVQAPHWLWSQPFLVPVRSSPSRSRSSSVVRLSTRTVCGSPFTVSDRSYAYSALAMSVMAGTAYAVDPPACTVRSTRRRSSVVCAPRGRQRRGDPAGHHNGQGRDEGRTGPHDRDANQKTEPADALSTVDRRQSAAANSSTRSPSALASIGETSTRVSWNVGPPPRSVSRTEVTALTLARSGLNRAQYALYVKATPGRVASSTATAARNEPRSLCTRTASPSASPRAAASD